MVANVVAVLVAIVIIAVFAHHALQEQWIIQMTTESALRQGSQYMEEELESRNQELSSEKVDESASAQTQAFSGTLLESSYQERASEVQAPAEAFPDAPVLLLHLTTPANATGYVPGDASPSDRMVNIVRVPDNLGAAGEHITIEVDEPLYWPSDISGALWDLDLSELQSIQVVSRSPL